MSSPVQKKSSRNNGEAPAALVSPQKKTRRSIKDFKIGTKVRREFDDGKTYTARVMTEPQCVWDAEQKKMVLSRLVKYYADNQEEWADEDQLNEWAYDSDDNVNEGEENWNDDATDEEGDDDDSFLFVNLDNDEVLGRNKQKTNSETRITPPVEIAPGSPTAPSKEGSSVEINQREGSPEKSSDTLSEITASSVAGSCNKSCDGNDGRRRSSRTRRQPDILTSPKQPPRHDPRAVAKMNPGVVKKARKEMELILLYKMGITKEEIDYALDSMSPPYSQNQAINIIQKRRDKLGNLLQEEEEKATTEKFIPQKGLKVRVPMLGSYYHGEVTSGPEYMIPEGSKEKVKMWTVTFDDKETEDYDWHELFRYRASRPIKKFEDCRGRTLNALELFCGEGIVTQEFCERKFNVKSIDIEPDSYAMMVLDIRKIKYEDIGFVPDFIWASPPCTTFTNLAGGTHRNIAEGDFERTQMAHDHNVLFAQMVCIMNWAKSKNPNLIVVIENPEAQMQKAPMMIEFTKTFGLYKAKVNYCALGRDDKKPTNLWTNVSSSNGKRPTKASSLYSCLFFLFVSLFLYMNKTFFIKPSYLHFIPFHNFVMIHCPFISFPL